ncbi:hypothetical protein, partial [Erwinia sp. S38]|uniref:hypothetical protein n=1 Tax=Erwinia sp. S38 TaxID=2769338 RepID=UPI001F23785A
AWHARGQRFDPAYLHQILKQVVVKNKSASADFFSFIFYDHAASRIKKRGNPFQVPRLITHYFSAVVRNTIALPSD